MGSEVTRYTIFKADSMGGRVGWMQWTRTEATRSNVSGYENRNFARFKLGHDAEGEREMGQRFSSRQRRFLLTS